MDAKRNRNKMLADTNESGYVWTGPKKSVQILEERTPRYINPLSSFVASRFLIFFHEIKICCSKRISPDIPSGDF